jgi:hypothetical protein
MTAALGSIALQGFALFVHGCAIVRCDEDTIAKLQMAIFLIGVSV